MRYAIVVEKAHGNYSAYVPDLPGCVATGETVATVESEIRDAIRFHIGGLKEDGLPVSQPTSPPDALTSNVRPPLPVRNVAPRRPCANKARLHTRDRRRH
jgi:predicted RNase H-like HicB family nuclease